MEIMVGQLNIKAMRYMIEYGPDDKRDRWGHVIKAAPVYKMYFDSNIEAEKAAIQISREHKKWTVCIYDTQGPEDEELPDSTLWLMVSYERGRDYRNKHYTTALHNKELGIK